MASQPNQKRATRRSASHASTAPSHAAGQRTARPAAHASVPLASDSESIQTISAGQGAQVTDRTNAAVAADRARQKTQERYLERHPEARSVPQGPERSRKNVAVLVLAAVAALALLFFVVRCATIALTPTSDGSGAQDAQDAAETPEDAKTAQTTIDSTLSFDGNVYSLALQESGRYGLVSSDTVFFEVEGTPVALMRHQSTFLVPENRDGGWDIVCYTLQGSATASYVVGSDGNMVVGSGDIQSVELDGDTVHVTDTTGATTDVSLL